MSEPKNDLDTLIAAERAALAQPPAGMDAVLARVEASLAAGVVPVVDVAPSAVAAQLGAAVAGGLIGPLGVVAVLLAVGGGVWLSQSAPPAPPPPPPPPAGVATSSTAIEKRDTRLSPEAPLAPTPSSSAASASPTPAPKRTRVQGDLRDELELLRRAQLELKRGVPSLALHYLEEHARRFPNGAVAEERRALYAIALCRAGRSEEGKAAARRFLQAHPQSPQAGRVKAECLP